MTLRLGLPARIAPVTDTTPAPFQQYWVQWLTDLAKSLGWAKDVPVWRDDLVFPASAVYIPAASVTVDTLVDTVGILTVPPRTIGYLLFTARLPNAYKDGTQVVPFLEWIPLSADVGDLPFRLDTSYAKLGEAFSAMNSDLVTATIAEPSDRIIQRTEFPAIGGSTWTKGTSVQCTLWYFGSSTYTDSYGLLNCGFKYQGEGVGQEVMHP